MAAVADSYYELTEYYEWCLTRSDKRVDDWFLMQGFTPTLVLAALYVLFVTKIGPWLMKDREPFKLKWPILIYNIFCIVINFHILTELFYNSTIVLGYSYSCQPVDFSNNPNEVRIAKALWWFYFSKCIEFLDTVFFVLRKKTNQISFLHVYHHATMFPMMWLGVKWAAGGNTFFATMVNSFIHVVMYTYYGIAALGPQYKKYLWWKRYLTILQIIQFNIGILHTAQSLLLSCNFPTFLQLLGAVYGSVILLFFLNFYFQAYINSRRKSSQDNKDGKDSGHLSNEVNIGIKKGQ